MIKRITAVFLVIVTAAIGLCGCSLHSEPPQVDEIETFFSLNRENILTVTDYLLGLLDQYADLDFAEIGNDSFIFSEDDIEVTVFTHGSSIRLERHTETVSESVFSSIKALFRAGCKEIEITSSERNSYGNFIFFRTWEATTGDPEAGIVRPIDPAQPFEIQFQTEIAPLSEQYWYYYIADYEKYRVEKPTFHTIAEEDW